MNNNIYPVYAIRDAVSNTFGTLMVESNEGTARRNFQYGCREGLMDFSRADFALFQIGTYNVNTGEFSPLPIPQLICQATDFAE